MFIICKMPLFQICWQTQELKCTASFYPMTPCNTVHGIAKSFLSVFIPYEFSFILVSWHEESFVGATPTPEIFGQNDSIAPQP